MRMTGRRARVVLTTAVVVIGGLVASACEPEVTKEVLFVNDSVTHQSIVQIVQELNAVQEDSERARYAPNFGSSVPGIGLRQVLGFSGGPDSYWAAHLASLIEHTKPEVVVVELGYNDCRSDLTTYGDSVDNFMEQIPSETPVHWLTVADAHDERTCDETINAVLGEATTRWSNLTLLDFAALMDSHPEWTDDGVHLNEAGRGEYAAWLHDELDARYGRPEEPEEPAGPEYAPT
jgi:lysophospholipase L1-like esterase